MSACREVAVSISSNLECNQMQLMIEMVIFSLYDTFQVVYSYNSNKSSDSSEYFRFLRGIHRQTKYIHRAKHFCHSNLPDTSISESIIIDFIL